MMTPEDKEAALYRAAMRGDASDTPAMLSRMLATLAAIIAAELSEREGSGITQQWGRAGQIGAYFGVTRATVNNWLPPLIAAGRVRVLTPPGGGYTLYNIPDIEKAFSPRMTR